MESKPAVEEAGAYEGLEIIVGDHPPILQTRVARGPKKADLYRDILFFLMMLTLVTVYFALKMLQRKEVVPNAVFTPVPVIGIVSKPLAEEWYDVVTNKTQIIEAKYVRWIEAGGAKPIYINYNASESELSVLLSQINGLMLIGGATELVKHNEEKKAHELTLYGRKLKFIIDFAKNACQSGNYFPIWGTCLGYEMLMLALSEDYNILRSGCNCINYNGILNFTEEAFDSKLYSSFTDEQMSELMTDPMTHNRHDYYVAATDFYNNPKLANELKILSTSTNEAGTLHFISSVEGRTYPFYGVQFHPEKSSYDFNPNHVSNHSLISIMVMQAYSVFFVEETRKNAHVFREDEEKYSVYNGEVGFDSGIGPVYLFS